MRHSYYFYRTIISISCLISTLASASSGPTVNLESLNDRDLAIIIPKSNTHNFPAFKSNASWGLMPLNTLNNISNAFVSTTAENSFAENKVSDWSIVSARVSPCSPLFPHIRTKDTLCWPELRVILQPILKNKIHYQGRLQEHFADDRSIHALFHISPYTFLTNAESVEADNYIKKLKNGEQLSETGLRNFIELRNKVSEKFLKDTLTLRSASTRTQDYKGFDIRPEFYDQYNSSSFTAKLTNYFKRHAFWGRLHTATAFSLPEGRSPVHLNSWVFTKFKPSEDEKQLEQIDITMHHRNGRIMFNLGQTETSTMTRDDEKLYADTLTERQKMMLSHHAVLDRNNDRALLDAISDRDNFLVEHTTCASCHKLNHGSPANFHALSYFINEPQPTVSQRVKTDVKRDLQWVKKNISK